VIKVKRAFRPFHKIPASGKHTFNVFQTRGFRAYMNTCGRARKKKVAMLLKKEQRELIKALEENGITASGKVADLKNS
jgi:hypothetical protein